MKLTKETTSLLQFVLMNGEERLHEIFFGWVDIPDEEWERRIDFRDDLDNKIRQATKGNLSLPDPAEWPRYGG